MRKALRVIDSISEWSGKTISFVILVIIAITVYEVVVRYAFNAPTPWSHEMASYLFGYLWVIGGAYALLKEQHVKMDLLYVRVPLRWRAILDLISAPLFFIFVGLILWKGWESAWLSLSILEHSSSDWGPPIYLVKIALPLGSFLLLLQGLAKFIRALSTASTGREAA